MRKPGQLLEWADGVCIGLGVGEGDGGTVENADRKLARNILPQLCKHSWSGVEKIGYVLDGAHYLLKCDDLADDPGEKDECEEEQYLTVVNAQHCETLGCSE